MALFASKWFFTLLFSSSTDCILAVAIVLKCDISWWYIVLWTFYFWSELRLSHTLCQGLVIRRSNFLSNDFLALYVVGQRSFGFFTMLILKLGSEKCRSQLDNIVTYNGHASSVLNPSSPSDWHTTNHSLVIQTCSKQHNYLGVPQLWLGGYLIPFFSPYFSQ